jgi:hypothetical protein
MAADEGGKRGYGEKRAQKNQPELVFLVLLLMVRKERLELSHLTAPEPKSGASTNFATSAILMVAMTGFEPVTLAL